MVICAFICHISILLCWRDISKSDFYAKHYVHLNVIKHFKLFSNYFPIVKIYGFVTYVYQTNVSPEFS